MSSGFVIALAAFAVMEPSVALVHRTVMHGGGGWSWHRSHHHPSRRPGASVAPRHTFEANDRFPILFAAATIAAMALGSWSATWRPLLWAGWGITAYGASYLVVHDGYVHGRLGRLPGSGTRYVRWVTARHAEHHRTGGAPYGFLFPAAARTTVQ